MQQIEKITILTFFCSCIKCIFLPFEIKQAQLAGDGTYPLGKILWLKAVFRIRTFLGADPDPDPGTGVLADPDPDPDPNGSR